MKIVSLTRNGQFQRLYRKGNSVVTPTMVLYASKNRLGVNRLGITAGKKVGGAVQRNRAKRRIRELFRNAMPHFKQGYDICIVARTYTVEAPAAKLQRDFQTSIEKLGMWNHENTVDSSDSALPNTDFSA